jgi:hypothetical protein
MRNGPGIAVFVSLAANLSAQVLPTARSTDWSKAGFQLSPPSSTITVDITTFGGIGDGVTANGAALFAAFTAVQGQAGVILFPPGDFLFTSTILLPDSVVLRGLRRIRPRSRSPSAGWAIASRPSARRNHNTSH